MAGACGERNTGPIPEQQKSVRRDSVARLHSWGVLNMRNHICGGIFTLQLAHVLTSPCLSLGRRFHVVGDQEQPKLVMKELKVWRSENS